MPVEELISLINDHLKNEHPGGATLSIVPEGIRQDDDWWYVPVKSDRIPDRLFEYYEALANVESQIEEDNQVTVLFIPVDTENEK
jgi:hypothetical protein